MKRMQNFTYTHVNKALSTKGGVLITGDECDRRASPKILMNSIIATAAGLSINDSSLSKLHQHTFEVVTETEGERKQWKTRTSP